MFFLWSVCLRSALCRHMAGTDTDISRVYPAAAVSGRRGGSVIVGHRPTSDWRSDAAVALVTD